MRVIYEKAYCIILLSHANFTNYKVDTFFTISLIQYTFQNY